MKLLPIIALAFVGCHPLPAATISAEMRACVLAIGSAHGVPRSVTAALMWEESRNDADAVGPVGADGFRCRGLFQLNPKFEAELVAKFFPHRASVFDVFDPLDNAVVALGYLGALHRTFGNWTQALWFYNCGEYKRQFVPESTKAYARRIVEAE
jgi:soluble lytic murein transglycosylase-like protein